jgi:hypothetical protein
MNARQENVVVVGESYNGVYSVFVSDAHSNLDDSFEERYTVTKSCGFPVEALCVNFNFVIVMEYG